MKSVHVVEYDPEWPRMFERIRAYVWPAVHDVAIDVEHVGSTSVPGLTSKPRAPLSRRYGSVHRWEDRLRSPHPRSDWLQRNGACCNQEHQPDGQYAAGHGRTAAPLCWTPLGDVSRMQP